MEEQVDDFEMEPPKIAAYSDIVSVRYSEYTFNFQFSQQVPSEGEKKFNPICLGKIVMSPQHAKMFHEYLGDVIEDYEKIFNAIQLKK